MQKLLAIMLLGASCVVASVTDNSETMKNILDEFKDTNEFNKAESTELLNMYGAAIGYLNADGTKNADQEESIKDAVNKANLYLKNIKEGFEEYQKAKSNLIEEKNKLNEALEKENDQDKKKPIQDQIDELNKKMEELKKSFFHEDKINVKKEVLDSLKAVHNLIKKGDAQQRDENGNFAPKNEVQKDNENQDHQSRNFVASALNYKDRLDLCQKDLGRLQGFLNTKGNEKLRFFVVTQPLTKTLENKNLMDVDAGQKAGDFDRKYMGMEAALRAEHKQCKNVKEHIARQVIDYYTKGNPNKKGEGKQVDKTGNIKADVMAKINELDGIMNVFGDGAIFNGSNIKTIRDVKTTEAFLNKSLNKIFFYNKKEQKHGISEKNMKNINKQDVDQLKEMIQYIQNDPFNGDTKVLVSSMETLLRCMNEAIPTGPLTKLLEEKGINRDLMTSLQVALNKVQGK